MHSFTRRGAYGLLGAVVALATAVGCAGDVAAPTSVDPASAALQVPGGQNTDSVKVHGLRWRRPRTTVATAQATIGPAGGTLTLAETGLILRVPAGAVDSAVTMTVTALRGRMVAYEFAPHMQFKAPLTLEQDVRMTVLKVHPGKRAELRGAYFADVAQLDTALAEATVAEFQALTLVGLRARMRFQVNHFSGYMVAVGRKGN